MLIVQRAFSDPGADGADVFGRQRISFLRHVAILDELEQDAVVGIAGLDHSAVLGANHHGFVGPQVQTGLAHVFLVGESPVELDAIRVECVIQFVSLHDVYVPMAFQSTVASLHL